MLQKGVFFPPLWKPAKPACSPTELSAYVFCPSLFRALLHLILVK